MGDDPRLQKTIDRLALELARVNAQLKHARAELSRVYEELDYRDETIRVLKRVIVRLGDKNGGR